MARHEEEGAKPHGVGAGGEAANCGEGARGEGARGEGRCGAGAKPRTAPMARRRDGDIAPYRNGTAPRGTGGAHGGVNGGCNARA